jgi:hypothetical protein
MATWPTRGQRGPQYWDQQLKAYVDAVPVGAQASADAAQASADAAQASADAAQASADSAAGAANAAQADVDGVLALTPTQVFLSAQDFMAGTLGGTLPVLVQMANRWNSWQMDAAATERISSLVSIPRGWTTVNVDLVWSSPATGNIVLNLYATKYAAGDLSSKALVAATGNVIIAASATVNSLQVSRIANNLAVTPGPLTGLLLDRVGNNGFDTVGTDVGFIGLVLTRV